MNGFPVSTKCLPSALVKVLAPCWRSTYSRRSELYPRSNSKDFTPAPVRGDVTDSIKAKLTISPAVPTEGVAKGLEAIPKATLFVLARVTLLVRVMGERVLSAVLVIESQPFDV